MSPEDTVKSNMLQLQIYRSITQLILHLIISFVLLRNENGIITSAEIQSYEIDAT